MDKKALIEQCQHMIQSIDNLEKMNMSMNLELASGFVKNREIARIALASLTDEAVGYTCQSELDNSKKGKTIRVMPHQTNGDPIALYTTPSATSQSAVDFWEPDGYVLMPIEPTPEILKFMSFGIHIPPRILYQALLEVVQPTSEKVSK